MQNKLKIQTLPGWLILSSWALLLVPVVIYIIFVIRYTVNVPIFDDHLLFLNFMNKFMQAGMLKARVWEIFVPHNEHRVVTERLLALAQYALTGKLNFAVLNYIGNLGWLACAGLVGFSWKDKENPTALDILPISFLLFAPINYENMFWASSSLPFYWGLFFCLLCIFCLQRSRLVPAGIFAALALFTHGAGLALLPLGWVYLALKRKYTHLIFSTIFSLALLAFFFHSYGPGGLVRNLFQPALIPSQVIYFFTFLGAPWQNMTAIPGMALAAGVLGVALAVVLFLRRRQDEFSWLVIGFVLLIAAEAAVMRIVVGLEHALDSRYAIFPLIFWCGLFVLGAKELSGRFKIHHALFSLLAIIVYVSSFAVTHAPAAFAEDVVRRSSSLRAFQYGYTQPLIHFDVQQARKVLTASRELGVYDYMDFSFPLKKPGIFNPDENLVVSPLQEKIEFFDRNRLHGWAYIPGMESAGSQVLILLDNGVQTYVLSPYRHARVDVSGAGNDRRYAWSSFDAYIYSYDVPDGDYRVGVQVTNAGNQGIYWLDKVIHYP